MKCLTTRGYTTNSSQNSGWRVYRKRPSKEATSTLSVVLNLINTVIVSSKIYSYSIIIEMMCILQCLWRQKYFLSVLKRKLF